MNLFEPKFVETLEHILVILNHKSYTYLNEFTRAKACSEETKKIMLVDLLSYIHSPTLSC